METVMLNDGSIEIVGSHRDLVDIVRDRCGDDIAKMVENLDPAVYDRIPIDRRRYSSADNARRLFSKFPL